MIILNNVTKEELNKKVIKDKEEEDLFLQENIDFMQNITNMGFSYLSDDRKYYYSSKFYEILERQSTAEDNNIDIIKNITIEKDRLVLKENHEKFNFDHKHRDFIIRIKTAKNNLKYIHCHLFKYPKNNRLMSYYKDVTEDQIYIENLKDVVTKSNRLKNALNNTLNISKTALSYKLDHKIYWTSSSFDILKLNYEEYKDYHGNFLKFVVNEDKHCWNNTYKKCCPSHPKDSCILRVINAENELLYIKCYIICGYNQKGIEINRVTFYQDITEQVEKENELQKALNISKHLDFSFKMIQGISKISMYYYNHETSEYTWYNDGYSILGLDPSEYIGDMDEYVIPEDKNIWREKHRLCTPQNPEVSFVQRAYSSGKLRYIKTYVAYEFDENGNKKSHISLFQDITDIADKSNELQKALDEAVELRNNLNKIQHTSKTVISYSNNSDDVIWTPEVFNILEINPQDYKDKMNHILDHFIIEEDIKHRQNALSKLSPKNPKIKFIQRVKTGKGNIKYIKTVIHQDYDSNGKITRRIGFNQDITREMEYQNRLEKALIEKTELSDNLNRIQSVSKTAIGYSTNIDNTTWTPEIYEILEIDSEYYKNDKNHKLDKFVIKEDLKYRQNCIAKLSPTNPDTTFTQRVKTGKGNIIHTNSITP